MNRAIEGPFDKQPLCEKDIPGEALSSLVLPSILIVPPSTGVSPKVPSSLFNEKLPLVIF
jgi:hypothetical protein